MTSTPWTDQENTAVCALYFNMLDCAIAGESYNKAAMIREVNVPCPGVKASLVARTRGSIEAKLMNCTAAHAVLVQGAVTMHTCGYRALSNYQKSLGVAMHQTIARRLMNSQSYRDYTASSA